MGLLDRYSKDQAASFLWGRVLALWGMGKTDEASAWLRRARRGYGSVEGYLKGDKKVPAAWPAHYMVGGESEAVFCSCLLAGAWRKYPGLKEWTGQRDKRAAVVAISTK